MKNMIISEIKKLYESVEVISARFYHMILSSYTIQIFQKCHF